MAYQILPKQMDSTSTSPRQAQVEPRTTGTSPITVPRVHHPPGALFGDLLALQRMAGNQAVQRLLGRKQSPPAIQRSALTVGPANDRYEQEAERIARSITDTPRAGKQVEKFTLPALQRQAGLVGAEGGALPADVENRLRRSQSSGSSLPESIRRTLEPKLGADLGSVKVHTDSNAVQLSQALGAKAFTHKNHIYFGAGQSPHNLKLTAHEAVHTIQQGAVRQSPVRRKPNHARESDPSLQVGQSTAPGVQRLVDRQGLISVAGEPHADKRFLGIRIKKMSTAYKAVLTALDKYHDFLKGLPTTEPGGTGFNRDAVGRINTRLDTLRDILQEYVDDHKDDTVRTPHIRTILTTGIPQERNLVGVIAQQSEYYLGTTWAEAIERAERLPGVTATVSDMFQKASARRLREADTREQEEARKEQRQAKPNVSGVTGGTLKSHAMEAFEEEMQKAQQSSQGVTAFTFRGETRAAQISGALGEELTRTYVQGVLIPALGQAINTRDSDIEVDEFKLTGVSEREKPHVLSANINRLKRYYAKVMRLFTAEGAEKVPLPFAQFCAELYDKSSEYMDKENAYLMVSSQIFLRTINPVMTYLASSIPMGQPGKRAMILLAKLVQDDANNVTHGIKEDYLKPFAGISYSNQIRDFVEAVVARGRGG